MQYQIQVFCKYASFAKKTLNDSFMVSYLHAGMQILEKYEILRSTGNYLKGKLLDFGYYKSKNFEQRFINIMNKFKALVVLLLVSLGALVGVTNYLAPATVVDQPEIKPVEEEISVESVGTMPETPRKLTFLPLFSGLLGAKLNFLGAIKGGFYGGYRSQPVVQETKIINTVNVVNNFPERSSLDGRYSLNFPQINFEINDAEFVFTGCNTHRVPYLYEDSRFFFGKIRSTRNDCGFDPAQLYVRQLSRIRRLGSRDNDIFFFDGSEAPLFGARFRKAGGLRKQFVFGGISQGFYDAQFPSYNVEFRNNNFWLQGCENNPVEFLWNRKLGGVSFRRPFYDSDCYIDRRDIFNDFFLNSERIIFGNDNIYEFQDDRGYSVVSCSPFSWK